MDTTKIQKLIKLAQKKYYTKSDEYDKILNSKDNINNILNKTYINSNDMNNEKLTNKNSQNRYNNNQNNNNNDNFNNNSINRLTNSIDNLNDNIDNINSQQNNQSYPQQNAQLPTNQQNTNYQQPNIQNPQAINAPINIVAKNYIDPYALQDGEKIEDISKKETKSHQLAKIPNNMIRSSTTDWEPINYRGVDESYHLYKLANVKISYDEVDQKLLYKIIEPELTKQEEEILEELKKGFIYVFEKIMHSKKQVEENDLISNGTKKLCSKYGIKLTNEQFDKIVYYLDRDFLGLDLLEPIMHDKFIEDVSCDGLGVPIFINHLKYGPMEVNRHYNDGLKLNSFIIKLAQKSNQEVSLSKPILQGALPDGSRVEAIYGKEVSEKGSSFTIRKFREEPFTPVHLMEFGTMPPFMLAYLWLAVENKQSILVSGGTATGKTTILNALSLFVPPTSKIVSIEDTPEINLPHEHWLPLISRENEGKAQVSMFDLLKASLRERPDYIIVGEIRGAEAAILFQGMATGHAGMGTVHAEKFSDLVNRMTIEPINLPKQLITELKICIFQKRVKVKDNMTRRTTSLVEVVDYDNKRDKFISNEFVKYSPINDTFSFNDKSFVISHLLELRGGEEDALWTEIEKRRRILDFMQKKKILEFNEVSKIIKYYYKDPKGVFDYLEKYEENNQQEEQEK